MPYFCPRLVSHEFKNVEISNLKLLTMANDSSYSSTETESNTSFTAVDFDSIVDEAEGRRVSPREETARKKRKVETKPRAVFPQDLRAIISMDKCITKCLYGQDYDYDTSLRVVGAALRMQKGGYNLQKVQRVGKEKAKYVEKPQIRDMVCNLFHIGHDAYSDIVGGYLHKRKVYKSGKGGGGRAGNSSPKESPIAHSKAMQIKVQDFVRGHWMNRKHVTARQVLDFFVEQKHLFIPVDGDGRYQKGPPSKQLTEMSRGGWLILLATTVASAKGTLYPLPRMVQRNTTTSGPSLQTEPSLQQRD
jgi:hypothetical protein